MSRRRMLVRKKFYLPYRSYSPTRDIKIVHRSLECTRKFLYKVIESKENYEQKY